MSESTQFTELLISKFDDLRGEIRSLSGKVDTLVSEHSATAIEQASRLGALEAKVAGNGRILWTMISAGGTIQAGVITAIIVAFLL